MKSEKKNDSDLKLFQKAMADVSPLGPENRINPVAKRPPAIARRQVFDEESVLEESLQAFPSSVEIEPGENLLFLRPGYQKRILRRLRKGHFGTADTIDLHHMTQQTASQVLLDFIGRSVQSGFSCVRIIHGKGLRSTGKPVLKIMTNNTLVTHSQVIAFSSCRPANGGAGAVDVLLVSKTRQKS